jgi:Flp pilus assembly pilin Flp
MNSIPIVKLVSRFLGREDGPTTVEYAVLLALIIGMMIASIIYVGDEARAWTDIVVDGLQEVRDP